MKYFLAAMVVAFPIMALAESYPDARSIVSIGGPVTEVIYALGAGGRIVARDTTSHFPSAVESLPDVGYMRQLSAEGVLSVSPDLIVTRDTAGPPETLDQLRAANVPLVEVHDAFTKESVLTSVEIIGEALGKQDSAAQLYKQIEGAFIALEAEVAQQETAPRVLFILSNQGGRLNVAGRGTGAHGMITLAGGENVMGEAFEGYKIMSDEALIEAAPDVVLMMTGREDHAGRKEDIFALPSLAHSPAALNDAFITIDPAALGFGPRTAQFARTLNADLAVVTTAKAQ
ncbi:MULTISPECIES: heme/hemin ABC transporter substrate-binding protein [Pacificibacter]|uniref:heme/hemin ABC transporter substrate-binding protein n=1 Tax=Pacificibacter TaxID=1042323 RepID=UPI001C089552|nr:MULTISPECIES: ABC transporter substrate-binding protein [Pacificibacter]MBU2937770.1 ABC transporter substrate-binding protein [Pacificibacter marinus]MDO6616031.1 ABC transporter substrate-binding protein [Pacificibacter sp. 1_MG-2023]